MYQHLADGKYHVIDGLQRLTAIRQYLNNVYPLTGLNHRKDLNGKKFRDLNSKTQNEILTYILDLKCVMNIVDNKIVYDIFERFNTGGVTLNAQEIRNCIFNGQFNDFIRNKLAAYKPFNEIISSKKARRMGKEELAVRFLAMYESDNYPQSGINNFINNYYESKQYLDSFNSIDFKNKTQDLERTFKKAIDASIIVFKNNAFKNYTKSFQNNSYKFQSFSNKIYDLQMLSFAEFDLADIRRNADKIYKKYIEFVTNDAFINSNTLNKQDFKTILRSWQDSIGEIINE